MTIYLPYIIFIAISLLTFLTTLILRAKYKKERKIAEGKILKIIIIGIVLCYIIKIFFGWRFSNWYLQAVILLTIFIYFDYLTIIKKYPVKLLTYYNLIRVYSFGAPIVGFVLAMILAVFTAFYGGVWGCKIFPQDRSYGVQKVYKNLYIYGNDCPFPSMIFKKRFLFFEKDVAEITGRYNNVFAEYRDSKSDPITGYISQKENVIYITGRKRGNHYIKLTILDNNTIQIEAIEPSSSPMPSGELQLEANEKQLIKL